MHKDIRYVVVSPVRNEESYLRLTIDSMVSQTFKPVLWVIVNDGSTDGTKQIADAAVLAHGWIKVINRADRGFRSAGTGVIEAFYEGYGLIDEGWDYLVKLDGDLSFENDYFERCFEQLERNARLGIAGGTICTERMGKVEVEFKKDPKFHVRGATKIYKRACWEQIGGLIRAPGWDTLDEVKANMLGWQTCTLEGISLLQHRPTGAAYGTWNDRVKSGLANYVVGYHPLFMLAKALKRMADRPLVVGGLALLFGFAKGYVKRIPRVADEALIAYFRRQQMNRLMLRESLWG